MNTSDIIRRLWYYLCRYILVYIPSDIFIQLALFIDHKRLGFKGYYLNLERPKTFNEKINYLKFYDRNELIPTLADKVSVRKYVSDVIGEKHLIPIIGIYNSVHNISFDQLPEKFALKTSHGCGGWNLICRNKKNINWRKEKKKLNAYMNRNGYYLTREWQYNSKPKLICEELLEYDLIDYKFFCNNGVAKAIQVDTGRFTNHQRKLFDVDWEELNIQIRYPKSDVGIVKPNKLDEMIKIANKLSKPIILCRVDLYEHKNKIYFGEITFYPGGGTEPFINYNQDLEFGKMFELTKTYRKDN